MVLLGRSRGGGAVTGSTPAAREGRAVGANEDCLWYVDKNGTWHNGFDCPLITFCCGNCNRRYCCLDAFKMITEREQKRCMLFQFRCCCRRHLTLDTRQDHTNTNTLMGANEDCLWYVDKNGTWHNGFDCPLITFCCGNCNRRYCCLDAFKMITEREQKRCMLFQFSGVPMRTACGTWTRTAPGTTASTAPLITLCCGNCNRRYCCLDAFKMITEREPGSAACSSSSGAAAAAT
ncbi:hypothetical protein CRUP_022885 [Coryphaenoides rupestris]|nr:hypothetical protein CRUP_022885 [Coryphaenoides rupestris]